MNVGYKKLWIMLAEQEISKATLRKQAGLSSATFTKLRKNQEVNESVPFVGHKMFYYHYRVAWYTSP